MHFMKSRHRSKFPIHKWSKDNYWSKQNDVLKIKDDAVFKDTIERVNIDSITVEEFIEKYEKGSRPVILTGVADNWKGLKDWQPAKLLERFGDSEFRIGEDDNKQKLEITLKEYFQYALFGRDDSPLYLFQSSLEDHPEAKDMLNDY